MAGTGGIGSLRDLGGDSSYAAGWEGVIGGASGQTLVAPIPAVGNLLSGGGREVYSDDRCGNRTDDTVIPKGLAGSQIHSNQTNRNRLGCQSDAPTQTFIPLHLGNTTPTVHRVTFGTDRRGLLYIRPYMTGRW